MVAFRLSTVGAVALLASLAGSVWGAAIAIAIDTTKTDQYADLVDRDGPDISIIPRALPDGLGQMTYKKLQPTEDGVYGGGYWYQQVLPDTATSASKNEVYKAAKISWTSSVADAEKFHKRAASVACALFIPSKGWILNTGLRGVPGLGGAAFQSVQTCNVVTDFNHRNWANCAEMNAMAIMLQMGWEEPTEGALMACYGNYGNPNQAARWVDPCVQAADPKDGKMYPGCKETMRDNPRWKHITILRGRPDDRGRMVP